MTRKKIIKITIFSILVSVLFALCIVLIVAVIKGRTLKVNPSRELDGISEEVEDVLWYSSISANSHNSQMWSVELYPNENRLKISLDDSRILEVVDPAKREATISLGCYIETMTVAFGAYGYDTKIGCRDGSVSVTYSKRENEVVDTTKLALIDKRHTDKRAYLNSPIKEETVNHLLSKYSALSIYQKGEENFNYIKEVSMDAIKVQSANQAYRDELAEWLRFSDHEATDKLDGITADMMGLKGIVKTFYYWTTTREKAKKDKFAQQGIDTAYKQLNHCGAFAVLTGGNTFEELINVGRMTQAFWFDCSENNIAVQPISAALETNPFSSSIQKDLGATAPVQMILRLGYVEDYGTNSGLRRNLSDYIIVK